MSDHRPWAREAIRIIEADFQRSADTHLIPLALPGLPGIELYFKDESSHPTGSLKHRLAGYDAIFLAVDARTASQIRPYLGTGRPIYATSQIDPGRHGGMLLIDLAGIRYLEAPWLAEPDLPGYEVYARTRSPASSSRSRWCRRRSSRASCGPPRSR